MTCTDLDDLRSTGGRTIKNSLKLSKRVKVMKITALAIPEVLILEPARFADDRGFFSETFNAQTFQDANLTFESVQDNHSLSAEKNTIRGLHFQSPPFAQDKLVRVSKGAIFDVAVDIRHGSPTFGQYVSATISAENWQQILMPKGFAHGFCTLEAETEVQYKVTSPYARDNDMGLKWNDPELAIDWPVGEREALLSERDGKHPGLSELPAYFSYR